jgi:glyoxylase-like metal-dependent hydrolase (beta-lactamase superfamily II)
MQTKIIHLSVTNDYLLPLPGGKYLLIDTGYYEDWELFRAQLARASVSLTDISHLLLTHHHDDHSALLNRVVEANPEIRVILAAAAVDLLLGGQNDRSHGGGLINRRVNFIVSLKQFYIGLVLGKKVDKAGNLRFPPYRVRPNDVILNGACRLDEIGIALPGQIFPTPGHSSDSITLLMDNGDCFVGDAAANFLQFAGTHYCVIFVQDLDVYYQSWQKIISAGARTILPAHGALFPVQRLTENIGKNRNADLVR